MLEACRAQCLAYLLNASSVYGAGEVAPFREGQDTDAPRSLHAATSNQFS